MIIRKKMFYSYYKEIDVYDAYNIIIKKKYDWLNRKSIVCLISQGKYAVK